jgi:hypothetical protein
MLLLLLVACGGSGSHAKPNAPTDKAKPDSYWDWHKSEPKSPAVPVRTTKFEPPQQCGQGPYRFEVDSVGSQFVESVHLDLCVTHEWKGSVRYVAPGYSKSEVTFGEEHEHHKTCRADATVIVASGSGSSRTAAKSGKPTGRGSTAMTAETKTTAVELRGATVANGVECPAGTHRVSVVNSSFSIGNVETPRPALDKGPIVFELWSGLPNDLKGVRIFVEQRGTPDGYTGASWLAYRAAHDAWYKGHDDALAKSRAQGNKWTTVERAAVTPQPPPARPESKPPTPSANASWIPGYWQFTDGWVWSAGFWRVPPKDIEEEKTVEVAAAPPAPKVEAAPDVAYHAQRKAVWTPGYWMWNGRGYIWIAGAWRIPEAAEMSWVAPVWQPTRRGTLRFVPGGFVRIGRRR